MVSLKWRGGPRHGRHHRAADPRQAGARAEDHLRDEQVPLPPPALR